MSNHNPDEKSGPRKPKVSLAMTISQRLGGPKAMAKAVADGQPVNIPALPFFLTGGRSGVDQASQWFGVFDREYVSGKSGTQFRFIGTTPEQKRIKVLPQ